MEGANAADIAKIHPDEERTPDDVLLRDEAPKPAVLAVIAIVAHHEIVPGRHDTRDAFGGRVLAGLRIRVLVALSDRHARAIVENDAVFDRTEGLDELVVVLHPPLFEI